MGCDCGKPKCDGHCGISPAVLQINNPSECVLFHRVEVPASMGDSTTNPPKNGAYKNVLLYYEADQTSWLYSSDGVPQKLVNGLTNYEDAINLPQINGVTLLGNKSLADIGVTDAINNALQPYTPSSELAEVAFSGSYTDLTNKPDIPSGLHVFYMRPPSLENTAPIYRDYEKTDQVTLAQFIDAISSGPAQIYIEYDMHTFEIYYVDQMDAFIPDPPQYTGTLYVSFGLRNQYDIGVRRFSWYEDATAPTYDSYEANQSDWNQTSPTRSSYIQNKPNLAAVATSGSYNDLSDKPTPTVLNMTYDTTAATWTATDVGVTLRETPSGTFPAILEQVQTFAVPTPVFTDASTGSTLDAEGLYNLLETGADVVLNGVPISVRSEWINGTTTFAVGNAVCNGVRLTEVGPYHAENLDPDTSEVVFSVDQFAYSATVSASADGSPNPRFLPFAIRVYKRVTFNAEVSPDPQTEYAFEVQGISYSRMNSPT